MPAKVYTDKDADLAHLNGKVCGIIGFGSQGHAHALNLKDSGVEVVVGLYQGSKSAPVAQEHGFQVLDVSEAVQKADIVFFATPDLKSASIYQTEVAPHLKKGKALLFSHGFAVHFKTIVPPAEVDVIMVAPKGPGHIVRRQYLEGKGVPALIAVYQNPSRQAKKLALAWAKGIGATRAGVLETTFKEETETDLFGEQTVLCGGLTALVQNGFETLVEAGYQPEMAYFECLHELKLIVDLMYEGGIARMRYSISDTAEFGDYTRGKRVVDAHVREEMKAILADIQSGEFAREWVEDMDNNEARLKEMRAEAAQSQLETVGKELRGLMHKAA